MEVVANSIQPRLRGLSSEQRRAFLKECLSRSEPERTALLSVIISMGSRCSRRSVRTAFREQWSQCFHDLACTWASRDGRRWEMVQQPRANEAHSTPWSAYYVVLAPLNDTIRGLRALC